MKLPFIHLKSIKKIKEGKCLIFRNKDNLLNNLFYPNNSINLGSNDPKKKIPKFFQDFKHRTQKSINHLSLRNDSRKKAKNFFLNTNISIINSNKTNSINIHHKRNNTDESNNNKDDDDDNIEKLKNPLNSFKIRKEISSLIFSSPENQNKFINYMQNGASYNYNYSNSKEKSRKIGKRFNIPLNSGQKLKLKFLKEEKEVDEDKTNLKDESLYSLFFHNDDKENKKENLEEKNIIKNIKRMKCWNNNILKDILPQNIQNYFEYKSHKVLQNDNCNNNTFRKIRGIHHRNNRLKTLISVNDKTVKSKYNFGDSGEKYKKINNILLNKQKKNSNIKMKWKKRLLRSSSTD